MIKLLKEKPGKYPISIELQKMMVEYDPKLLGEIGCPTEEVQKIAISAKPSLFQELGDIVNFGQEAKQLAQKLLA